MNANQKGQARGTDYVSHLLHLGRRGTARPGKRRDDTDRKTKHKGRKFDE